MLSANFADSMVLQHDSPCIWGYGNNKTGAGVTVSTNADGDLPHRTTVRSNNTWRICLPPMSAGGPFNLNVTVLGFTSANLTDVLFGEVWVASGQSNMVAYSNFSSIRRHCCITTYYIVSYCRPSLCHKHSTPLLSALPPVISPT